MTRTVETRIYVERESAEREVRITALFYPGYPACFNLGECESDWAEEVSIVSATTRDGADAHLADEEIQEAVDMVIATAWSRQSVACNARLMP